MTRWTLHHGDCDGPEGLVTLPDLSVDVTITDPPYSAHVHGCSMRGASGSGHDTDIAESRDLGFEAITPELMRYVAEHVARVTRRWALMFCDERSDYLWRAELERAGMKYARTGWWVKLGGTPQFTGDRPAVPGECIVIAHAQPAARWRWNGGGKAGLWSYPIVSGVGRLHTTQKPLALMEALVRDFTDPDELILDPFAGSGTTGVAALRNGRRFVGWERDAKYHAVASARLEATKEQLSLIGTRAKERQVSLLGGKND